MYKVKSPLDKFATENEAIDNPIGFGSFTLKNKNPDAGTVKELKFYDQQSGVDTAPDTVSWGGETEVNIEYFNDETTRNIEVGRNLDDDICIEGKLLGKNAVHNANVMNAWRLAKDRLEMQWNGLYYEMMIGKCSFKAVDTFEVEYTINFKVIHNKSFSDAAVGVSSLTAIKLSNDKVIANLLDIDASLAVLASLNVVVKDNLTKSWLDNLKDIINKGASAVTACLDFVSKAQNVLNTLTNIVNAPKNIINGMKRAASHAIASVKAFTDAVGLTINALTTAVTNALSPGKESVSPAVAQQASIEARRAALKAKYVAANIALQAQKMEPQNTTYRVKAGDTMRHIALRLHLTPKQIRAANGDQLDGITSLRPGTILKIPPRG